MPSRRKWRRKYAFFNFTKCYFGTHSNKLPEGWAPDAAIINEFHDWLLRAGYRILGS